MQPLRQARGGGVPGIMESKARQPSLVSGLPEKRIERLRFDAQQGVAAPPV
jgi:hypothetical protein